MPRNLIAARSYALKSKQKDNYTPKIHWLKKTNNKNYLAAACAVSNPPIKKKKTQKQKFIRKSS